MNLEVTRLKSQDPSTLQFPDCKLMQRSFNNAPFFNSNITRMCLACRCSTPQALPAYHDTRRWLFGCCRPITSKATSTPEGYMREDPVIPSGCLTIPRDRILNFGLPLHWKTRSSKSTIHRRFGILLTTTYLLAALSFRCSMGEVKS